MAEEAEKNEGEIAYTVPMRLGPDLPIKKSANAWWMNSATVTAFVSGLNFYGTIREACEYVGITEKQYKYFARFHPAIKKVRPMAGAYLMMKARASYIKALEQPRYAIRHLEKNAPAEFGAPDGAARVQEALQLGWEQKMEQIKAIAKVREQARRGKINIPGFTDNDDPMPWNPKDHKKEFQKVMEEYSLQLRKQIDVLRTEARNNFLKEQPGSGGGTAPPAKPGA